MAKMYAEKPDPSASLLYLQATNALMMNHELESQSLYKMQYASNAELVTLFESEI